MKENDKILKAKEVLDRLNDNEEERERAYQRQRAIRYQNALRESGYDEGFEEGEKNRTIELIKGMLNENIDIETISKITGLTKDEIESFI